MAKISSYSVNTTPSLNDKLIGTDIDNSNITKNFTISEVLALGGSGVVSLNNLVGALTLVAGTGITITPSGTDITIASTGGGGESGTVTSIGGTGTVSGITLSGTVTTSGNLSLGGTLSLTSANITTGLGFTPYNATNPEGYTNNLGVVTTLTTINSSGPATLSGNTLNIPQYSGGGGGETYDLNATANGSNVDLNLNSTSAADDSTVQLTAGSNITLTRNSAAEITIASTGGGGGSGTVTSVTAGTGMTQTGTSNVNPTLNVIGGTGITANANDISINNSVVTLTGSQALTNKSGSNNQWTNDAGYTTNTGDITGVTAGTGMSGGGTSGTVILNNASPNATHTGEVTGSGVLTIADDIVDEANLKVSNTPTDGYMLTAQSSAAGGLTWAAAGGGGGLPESYSYFNNLASINIGDSSGTPASNIDYVVATTLDNLGSNVAPFAEGYVNVVGRVTIKIGDLGNLMAGLSELYVKIWQSTEGTETLGSAISASATLKLTSESIHSVGQMGVMSGGTVPDGDFYVTIATVPVKLNLSNGTYISMTARLNNNNTGYPLGNFNTVERNMASMQITEVIDYDGTKEQQD